MISNNSSPLLIILLFLSPFPSSSLIPFLPCFKCGVLFTTPFPFPLNISSPPLSPFPFPHHHLPSPLPTSFVLVIDFAKRLICSFLCHVVFFSFFYLMVILFINHLHTYIDVLGRKVIIFFLHSLPSSSSSSSSSSSFIFFLPLPETFFSTRV